MTAWIALLNNPLPVWTLLFACLWLARPIAEEDDAFRSALAISTWSIVAALLLPAFSFDLWWPPDRLTLLTSANPMLIVPGFFLLRRLFPPADDLALPAVVAGVVASPELLSRKVWLSGFLSVQASESLLTLIALVVLLRLLLVAGNDSQETTDPAPAILLYVLGILVIGLVPAGLLFLARRRLGNRAAPACPVCSFLLLAMTGLLALGLAPSAWVGYHTLIPAVMLALALQMRHQKAP